VKKIFPSDFLWGASTSAHQVEGNNFHNDWWLWEQQGRTPPSGKACDHYNRFREDFALAKDMGHNAHRLGIEWSRVAKDENAWNMEEWEHYRKVIRELRSLNITPIVTLHHFTVPMWFSAIGSWMNNNAPRHFTRFAVKAVEELGEEVEYWITINEPNILAMLGYYFGQWPPYQKEFEVSLIVIKNMLKSHALAYENMHKSAANNPSILSPQIGIAKAVTAFHPCSSLSIRDRISTYTRSIFHNHSFIVSLITGKISVPQLEEEYLTAKDTLDFIGLNYYFRQFIRTKNPLSKNPFGEVCPTSHRPEAGKITDMGWEIYPEGLYAVLNSLSRYKKPFIITENGIATEDDTLRKRYIKDHLLQIHRAIDKGISVKGYLHWSLLDNFEWAEGFTKRFGLVNVDYNSQKRTVKDSARYYSSVIKDGLRD